jgi:CheY-like chemotaxis protein/HPt (histidine-containing phosphotransfer) domain-containing protein
MLAKEMADAANEAKSNFLSNMSHEIRTPLTAIIGFSEALLSSEFDRQEHEKLITTIVRNSRHLQNIINDILDLSKIESNRLEHRLVDISPYSVLAEIQSLIGPASRDKGLDFSINYHFPLPAKVHTEPVYLKQILINLCSNASKFTSKGFVRVDVSCDETFRHLRLTVADSGIGMTPDEVERIFEPFIQADSTTTREYGGTGLGLAISSKLAEAIGGSLHCSSEKGKGSTFTLEIVNELADSSGIINSMAEIRTLGVLASEVSEIRKLAGKVLLVEDSPDNQELIEMLVRRTGASIDIAADGKHGLDMALAGDYDLVLMDMQMPVLDGLGAIRLLRKNDYSGPIISLTANALLTNREKCLAAGANDYLVKPIETSYFYETLNRYLPAAEATTAPVKGESGGDRRKYGEFYNSPGYLKIVERFRNKLPQMVTELAEAVRREDWERVQSQSHDLKGIGGSVGMPEITEVADRMNIQVRSGEYAQVRHTCAELEHLYQVILQQENEETPAH